MSQEVIPFELNFKHFLISVLVFLALVRLLFYVFGGRLHQSWLWKSVAARTKGRALDAMVPLNFSPIAENTEHWLMSFGRTRRVPSDSSLEDIGAMNSNIV
jgi:hypothetical protein